MARIAGVDLPRRKRMDIALTYIYGIGRSRALEILQKANVEGHIRTDDLTEIEARRIREVIDSQYQVEGDLRRIVRMNIKRLMDLGTYRGSTPPTQPTCPRSKNQNERTYPQRSSPRRC